MFNNPVRPARPGGQFPDFPSDQHPASSNQLPAPSYSVLTIGWFYFFSPDLEKTHCILGCVPKKLQQKPAGLKYVSLLKTPCSLLKTRGSLVKTEVLFI